MSAMPGSARWRKARSAPASPPPDPAVTGRADPAPLRAVRAGPAGPASARPVSDCSGGCNPFAWIAELLAADIHEAPGGDESSAASSPSVTADAPPAPAPAGGDLRTPELVGRVWIAPFADADGVYHEAGWVRLVIEPAGWRLR